MKRKIAILLALLMVLSALPVVLSAESSDEWVLLYRLSEDPAFTDVEVSNEFNFDGHQFLRGNPGSTITVEEDEGEYRRLQIVTDHDEDALGSNGFTIPLTELKLGTSIMIRFRVDALPDEGAMFILQRDHTPLGETHTALRAVWEFEDLDELHQFNIVLNDFNLTPAEGYEDVPLGFTIRSLNSVVNVSIIEIEILAPAEAEADPETETETEPEPEPTYTEMRFTIGSTAWTEDGVEQAPLEAAPFITGDRAMVPLFFVAQAMGAEVALLRGTPRVVTIDLGDTSLRLTIGEALPDGMGTPVILGGRTFVPIGYVSDVLGVTTRWCNDTNSVYVYVPAQ